MTEATDRREGFFLGGGGLMVTERKESITTMVVKCGSRQVWSSKQEFTKSQQEVGRGKLGADVAFKPLKPAPQTDRQTSFNKATTPKIESPK